MKKSKNGKILVTAVTLVLALSALSAVTGEASASTVSTQMGNFTFTYDTVTSTLNNINYTNPNYTVNVASSVLTSGMSSAIAQLGHADVSKTLELTNVTLFSTEDMDMLLMSTTNTSTLAVPSITVNLPGAASQVILTTQQKSAIMETSNSLMDSFVANPVYRMAVTDGYVYYFSNSPSLLANSGKTIVFQNNSFTPYSSLVVGTTPSATIKYSLDHQLHNYNLSADPLTYDKTTGDVSGTYLSLNWNANTGVISDYTNKYTNTVVFSQIYSHGNGSIGGGFVSPLFPDTSPIVLGSAFYFANNTAVYQAHNNIATLGNFYLSNGTTVMKVASGLGLSVMHPGPNAMGMKYKYGYNYSNFSNLGLGNQYMIQAAPTIVVLQNSTFRGELFVHDGDVTISGNTIMISTTEMAYSTFVAQVWYQQAQLQVRNQLQYAMQHGMLGAMVSVGPNGATGSNLTLYYNSSMQLTVQNAYANRVQIQVQANIQHGTNVALFIPNSVMKNNTKFTLMYDNQQMTMLSDMNGVLNSTNQNQATYYLTQVSGGTLVVVNVPHFSTHTIEITSAASGGIGDLWLYIVITVVVVAAASITAFVLVNRNRRRRQ